MFNRIHILTFVALFASTLVVTPAAQAQTTWYVDDDAPADPGPGDPTVSDPLEDGSAAHPFDAIQEGIDGADADDTVLVLDGTYTGPGNRDLDLDGSAITVRSENGPDNCIIDCQGSPEDPHRGFHFHNAETADAVVDGFMITNGNVIYDGGAICCIASSGPTIRNCTIVGNAANGGGGGIYCSASSPVIEDCAITLNSGGYGGGVSCLDDSNPTIRNCTLSANMASVGAGLQCFESSPTIINCVFAENTGGDGAGIACEGLSSPAVVNCTIAANTAYYGAGVLCDDSDPTMANCRITGNVAQNSGGGIACYGYHSPAVRNCTVAGNTADEGGGMFCGSDNPTIANCIIWANTPTGIYVYGGDPSVTYSAVQGGWDGEGNVEADPLFVDPDGPDDDPNTWEDNDFRLAGPTCIDAANNDAVPADVADLDGDGDTEELLPVDLDGLARFADVPGTPDTGHGTAPIVDMGAYEFEATTPLIGVSPTTLQFSAPEGGPNPEEQVLAICNIGGGTLNWEISADCPWLAVEPSSGQCEDETDEVAVSVDVGDLPYGEHTCELSISDPSAPNSPTTVPVGLVVFRFFHVPSEYATIQAAIDATAMDGDMVLVADDTYTGTGNKNLDFGGKPIIVRSANGPDNCIIDCEDSGQGFYFHSGETAASLVEGFTITNGNAAAGGGIRCSSDSSPTITNCTIMGNTAGRGGGFYCSSWESRPTITNCVITGNTAMYGGGGIGCRISCSPTIRDCTISANTAPWGGAIQCLHYDPGDGPTLVNCTITENTATYGGGAVDCNVNSGPTFVSCIIAGNSSGSVHGGAIWCSSNDMLLLNCVVANNNTDGDGGAVWLDSYTGSRFENCLFSANSAERNGGAFFCGVGGRPELTNCTITGNQAAGPGGGLYCDSGSTTIITNCILWDDSPDEVYLDGFAEPAITFSDVQGSWPGEGNIDADPALAFPDDAHLMSGSPCIDAGTNEPPSGLPATDMEGNPRVVDGDGDLLETADIGAIEYDPTLPAIAVSPPVLTLHTYEDVPISTPQMLYIRRAGVGVLNWTIEHDCSWLNIAPLEGTSTGEVNTVVARADATGLPVGTYGCALRIVGTEAANSPRLVPAILNVFDTRHVPAEYATIQDAIDAAAPGDRVVVAAGAYTGPGNRDLDLGGKPIVVMSASGAEDCVIDCEGQGRGFIADSGEPAGTTVSGFTITNGSANRGGGIYVDYDSSLTIKDCIIRANTASYAGGGVYCDRSSDLTLRSCLIHGNSAGANGGAIVCEDFSGATLVNCTISGNSAGAGGGVSCWYGAVALLASCSVTGNTAVHRGGGAICYDADLTLTNCLIVANTAAEEGGAGVYSDYGVVSVANCTIAGNTAPIVYGGGGLYLEDSDATIANSVVWGNQPDALQVDAGTVAVGYCDVEGGWAGEGNIDADPLFVDPDGPDNDPNTWEDNDYHLGAGSPCIDAADNTAVPADTADLDCDGNTAERTPLDLDGILRFVDDPTTDDTGVPNPPHYPNVVDMGAYEFGIFGDLDGDCDVDLSDLAQLLTNYGTSSAGYDGGDLDLDGDVDLTDLAVLLSVYGTTCP